MRFFKIGSISIFFFSCYNSENINNSMKHYFRNNTFLDCAYLYQISHFSSDSCKSLSIEFKSPIQLYISKSISGVTISYFLKSLDSNYIVETSFIDNSLNDLNEILKSLKGEIPKINLINSNRKNFKRLNNDMAKLPYCSFCYSDIYSNINLAMTRIKIFPFNDDRFDISIDVNNKLQIVNNRDYIHDSLVKCILESCKIMVYMSQ